MNHSPSDIRKARKMIDRLRVVSLSLNSLSEADLIRVLELDRMDTKPDGWPTGGEGRALQACPHGADEECDKCPVETTSVEAAVFARMGQSQPDPIGESCRLVLMSVDEIMNAALRLSRNMARVKNANVQRKAAERSDRCECCGDLVMNQGDDRIRSGFCNACRVAWSRWKKDNATHDPAADRRRFKAQRRSEVAA